MLLLPLSLINLVQYSTSLTMRTPSSSSSISLILMDDSRPIILFLFVAFMLSDTRMLLARSHLSPIVNTTQIHTYIVHVHHPDDAELLSAEERKSFYTSFLPNLTLDSGEPRLVYTYSVAISGFAAKLTADELKTMESMEGFVYAHREVKYIPQTTYTPEFLGLNQYSKSLWQASNYGEGIIIGVIDTGIVPTHPSVTDDGTMPQPPTKWRGKCSFGPGVCNNKLIGAVSFFPGVSSPLDIEGHGTFVAGIAAGNKVYDVDVLGQAKGEASGIAPRAHLAVYKTCHNGCSHSVILKGIDQAIQDGVDVIQVSLAAPTQELYNDGIAKGSYAALKKGIFSSCGAGNWGPKKSKIGNDAPWILTAGASSTDRIVRAVVKLGNGMEIEAQSGYQPNPSNLTMLPLIYPGVKGTQETLSCQNGSMNGFDVGGKMVLCGTGYIDNTEKAEIVKAAGGAAVIVMNQPWEGYTLKSDPYAIPAAHVSFHDALKILNYFQTDRNPTGTILFKGTEFGYRPAPSIASLSSRGPSLVNGGILKPDIVAPGVNILSAWHKEVGLNPAANAMKMYSFATGTSAAAPHVSGIVALLKRARPEWSAAEIKSAIMTTAYKKDSSQNPFSDDALDGRGPADAFAVGAGHVNPAAASDPGLVYDINPDDYISYLCGLKGYSSRQVSVVVGRPIACSRRPKLSVEQLNYPSILVSMGSTTTKSISRTVKFVGEEHEDYTVSVTQARGSTAKVTVKVTPTTLQFDNPNQEESFTIEFSIKGTPPSKDEVLEGELAWISSKHRVSSPIVVTA